MNTITKDLGAVTAYAVAVANGYTGTEAEWAQQLTAAATASAACNANQANIASVELETATANHAVGDLIICKNQLYKVTAAIATGESIVSGTNVTATTVEAQISAAKASVYDDLAMDYRLAKYGDISTSYIFDHDIRTGQYISVGQHLLRATTDIYSGNTLIPGTNCVFANVGEVLTSIIEQLN